MSAAYVEKEPAMAAWLKFRADPLFVTSRQWATNRDGNIVEAAMFLAFQEGWRVAGGAT